MRKEEILKRLEIFEVYQQQNQDERNCLVPLSMYLKGFIRRNIPDQKDISSSLMQQVVVGALARLRHPQESEEVAFQKMLVESFGPLPDLGSFLAEEDQRKSWIKALESLFDLVLKTDFDIHLFFRAEDMVADQQALRFAGHVYYRGLCQAIRQSKDNDSWWVPVSRNIFILVRRVAMSGMKPKIKLTIQQRETPSQNLVFVVDEGDSVGTTFHIYECNISLVKLMEIVGLMIQAWPQEESAQAVALKPMAA